MSSRAKSVLIATGFVAGLAASFAAGLATAGQPAMRNALENLREARTNLNNATWNKGGHRVEAIRLVNLAIDQVQAGIADGAN